MTDSQQLCQQYHDDTMTRLITTTPGDLDADVLEVVEHWTFRPGIPEGEGLELQSVEYLLAFGGPTQRLTVDYHHITVTTIWGDARCETSEPVSGDWLEVLCGVEKWSKLREAKQRVSW